MSTLSRMKTRIANELARDDLTDEIADAISDAIRAYQDERFVFNESRANTFATVATQEFYSKSDASWIANLQEIDYVTILYGDQPYTLITMSPEDMELASTNGTSTGQPAWYCYYNENIRLYPVPADARTVRIAGSMVVAAPATDVEADNPWMVKAERLIRSRAKMELAIHVLQDLEMARVMDEAVKESFEQLKSEATKIMKSQDSRVKGYSV